MNCEEPIGAARGASARHGQAGVRSTWRFLLVAALWLWPSPAWAGAPSIVGWLETYRVQAGDTLAEVARRHGLGYVELVAANPGVDPWLPEEGDEILLPTAHIVPDALHRGIVVNLADMRLYHFRDDRTVVTYPIGIGSAFTQTPAGETAVTLKREKPTWIPPASIRAENPDLPAAIGPGPGNPLGDHALNLGWPSYVIHGTNRPYGIGRRVSHGCIRLFPDDVAELFAAVSIGTPVRIVDQPVKFGWFGGELYLEVHPTQLEADTLEQGGRLDPDPPSGIAAAVLRAAGAEAHRLDWQAINVAARQRLGVPVQISGSTERPLVAQEQAPG